jgi:hypothetical protein
MPTAGNGPACAPKENNGNGGPLVWSMGLTGVWRLVGQITAVSLICVLFYQTIHEGFRQAREDRVLFREEMASLRHELELQRQHDAEQNAATLRIVEDLLAEMKRVKLAIQHLDRDLPPAPAPARPEEGR